jgi:outer membrane murein-binding lipoprotein Lpp
MKKISLTLAILGSMLLAGCASQTGWAPTAGHLNQDMAECQQLASQASGGTAKEAAIGAGVGGLIGAAGGAALGAIVGNPGTGAAIGAAAGGIGGASQQGIQSEGHYKNAYNNCLRNRGHKVVN